MITLNINAIIDKISGEHANHGFFITGVASLTYPKLGKSFMLMISKTAWVTKPFRLEYLLDNVLLTVFNRLEGILFTNLSQLFHATART